MLKNQKIIKSYQTEKGKIYIAFQGEIIKENNIDIEKLLEICIKNLSSYENPTEIVALVRTILKNYNEEILNIVINSDDDNKYLALSFENKELSKLETNNFIKIKDKKCYFTTNYNLKSEDVDTTKLEVTFTDKNKFNVQAYNNAFSETVNLINKLNYIEPKQLILTEDEKRLWAIFKTYYGENPKFTDENINIKIQALSLCILSLHNIPLNNIFNIRDYQGKTMPISLSLTEYINEMIPHGTIDYINEEKYLTELEINYLKATRIIIKESIQEGQDELNALVKFSNSLYKLNVKKTLSSKQKETKVIDVLKKVRSIKTNN